MDIDKIFNYLEKVRGLPTYQLERRLDVFLVPYIETAFNSKFQTDDFLLLCPEFPLWRMMDNKPQLDKSNKRSIYADYVLWSKKLNNTVFIVELKTDASSFSKKQCDTYLLNCKEGWESLMKNYLSLAVHAARNGGPWRKYCYGLNYMYDTIPELTGSEKHFELHKFYEKKRGVGVSNFLEKIQLGFTSTIKTKIIYLAPTKAIESLNRFKVSSNEYFGGNITLSEFANYTDNKLAKVLKIIDSREQ